MHNDDNSQGNSAPKLQSVPAQLSQRARREARVAAALRDNLIKRKQQARARSADSAAETSESSVEQG